MAVPFRGYDEVEAISLRFLDECRARGIVPVPIDTIVEFGLDLEIVPLVGLRQDFDAHAFLSNDFRSIYVDEDTMKRFPETYRFSLAHELGHFQMHDDVYPNAPATSIPNWLESQRAWRDDADYRRCEGQAYDFAGLVLVPTAPLQALVHDLRGTVGDVVYFGLVESPENRGPVLTAWGKIFAVNPPVIEKRLIRSCGWREDAPPAPAQPVRANP